LLDLYAFYSLNELARLSGVAIKSLSVKAELEVGSLGW
jgi:hypothetical protein